MNIKIEFNVKIYMNDKLIKEETFSTNKENNTNIIDEDEIIQYGKCRGMKYIDLDPEYLKWLIKESNLPEEEKEKCKRYLEMKNEYNKTANVVDLDEIPF